MAVDKITPNDSRISHGYATLNGHKYHYLIGIPQGGQYKATVFLIHGWPDISFGWRYQIPFLLDQGIRVVSPDMLGYGGTDAPEVPPNDISLYGFKRAADDMSELAKQLNAPRIILGGHDWGGMVVYRFAQWKPNLVSHVFSVCTPYMPPTDGYVSTEDLVNGQLPQFSYQLQLAGPEVESKIQTRERIARFLQGMYGGRTSDGKVLFDPLTGLDFGVIDRIGPAPLLNEEELEYYTDEYARSGLHGPLNWYRTRKANFEDERNLTTKVIHQPVLFIAGTKDTVLKPEMSIGMEDLIPNLSKGAVPTGHWALTQAPAEVNSLIKGWLDGVVFGAKTHL